MTAAVVVDAVRTATGARNGCLSGWHPAELAGACLTGLARRNDLDPALVDDVVLGCMMQVGAQSANVARSAVLAAGWPETVPATTVDRQCGSAQQAVHFAAQGVAAGAYDVVVAGGVEVMSLVPMGASLLSGYGKPFGERVAGRYAERGGLVPLGVSAELVAERWDLTRDELDAYALRSHDLAGRAAGSGWFAPAIVAVPALRRTAEGPVLPTGDDVVVDETIRPTTAEELAGLRPAYRPGGRVTAGNSAQIADGAAAVLIASEEAAARLGLRARARFCGFAVAGGDPVAALTPSIPGTARVLDRLGLALADIDLAEVDESFASAVLAWERALRPDPERVNVNGGAIALGQPLGAGGARLLATLVHELERRGDRYGLQVTAEAGGLANALVLERLG
jgi:acetyl-CoA acetyltransferase family protein